jgi:hypothetical protein
MQSQTPPYVGLLDLYPNASCAYSVRLLRSAYTGKCIRVRRSNDNAEQDIGFVSGNLDTTSLASFCIGTNGFVTTWYDQSGNGYNATQPTASSQPQIVSSGSVITKNGKPCVQISSNQQLLATFSPSITYNVSTKQSVYGVFTPYDFASGVYGRVFTQNTSNVLTASNSDYAPPRWLPIYQDSNTSSFAQYLGGATNQFTTTLNQQYLYSSYNLGGGSYSLGFNTNPISNTTGKTPADYTADGGIGKYAIGLALSSTLNEKLYIYTQETINYLSDNLSSRSGITSNINTYYNVY